MASTFDEATAVRSTGPGEYEAFMDKSWWGAGGPHGGYLSATLLRALARGCDDDARAPRSFSVHFAGRPVEGPARIRVTVDRVGRSITYVSAILEQEANGVLARALGAFSVPWEAFAYDDTQMPALPGPAQAVAVPAGERMPPFMVHVESRAAMFTMPLSGADRAETAGWMRFAEPIVPDAFAVAMFADGWLPSAFVRATTPIMTPTVDLSVHFCAGLPLAGARADEFVLGRFTSNLARDGFFVEDGELWSEGGMLLARSRQHALALRAR